MNTATTMQYLHTTRMLTGNPFCPFPLPWFILINIMIKVIVPAIIGLLLLSLCLSFCLSSLCACLFSLRLTLSLVFLLFSHIFGHIFVAIVLSLSLSHCRFRFNTHSYMNAGPVIDAFSEQFMSGQKVQISLAAKMLMQLDSASGLSFCVLFSFHFHSFRLFLSSCY